MGAPALSAKYPGAWHFYGGRFVAPSIEGVGRSEDGSVMGLDGDLTASAPREPRFRVVLECD